MNIGGKKYIIRCENILNWREPNSLLEFLVRADHKKRLLYFNDYCEETSEYYLERNAKIAEVIMDYFLTGISSNFIFNQFRDLGTLHKPYDICLERFREELFFWHLTNVEVRIFEIKNVEEVATKAFLRSTKFLSAKDLKKALN